MTEHDKESIQLNQTVDLNGENSQDSTDRFFIWFHRVVFMLLILPFSFFLMGLDSTIVALLPCGAIIIVWGMMAVFLCVSVSALRRVKKGGASEKNRDCVFPSIVLSVIFLIAMPLSIICILFSFNIVVVELDNVRLHNFSYIFEMYLEEHGGKLPSIETWCDEFRQVDIERLEDSFRFNNAEGLAFGREEKETMFGINKYIAELKTDLPDDMVVFFECEPGWNVNGGAELAKGHWPYGFVWIVFGDGSVDKYTEKEASYLRWRYEDDGVIPLGNKLYGYLVFVIGIGGGFAGLLCRFRRAFCRYWEMSLILGFLAGLIGAGLGTLAAILYSSYSKSPSVGLMYGGGVGVLSGIVYVAILGEFADEKCKSGFIMPYAIANGAVLGIVCSCAVHGLLMIDSSLNSFLFMGAGVGFGALAGVVLGWISSWVMKLFYKTI